MGCNPWGYNESDTTERLHFSLFSFIDKETEAQQGEGAVPQALNAEQAAEHSGTLLRG